MTTVTLLRDKGRLAGYQVDGHSGFDKAGQDIVCAALSMLAITCANGLESLGGHKPHTSQKDGHLRVTVSQDKLDDRTDIIFGLFELGVKDLARQYPRHVRLIP